MLLLLLLHNHSPSASAIINALIMPSSSSHRVARLSKASRVMRLRGAGDEAAAKVVGGEIDGLADREPAMPAALNDLVRHIEVVDRARSAAVSPCGNAWLARSSVQHVLGLGKAAVGSSVVVCGWARTIRLQGAGAFAFLELNDGSTFHNIQVVADKGIDGWEDIVANAHTHTSWRAEGVLVESPGKGQETELKATSIRLLGMLFVVLCWPQQESIPEG